mmetsp:Transcript_27942/g.43540  ORF Transcript_27942/g.43540 Transcript_27942/m.43540 type:complete len:231 (+) Transcript_27942:1260-1952(+)
MKPVASMTSPFMTIQISSLVLCFSISDQGIPSSFGAAAPLVAPAPEPTLPKILQPALTPRDSTIPGLWMVFHSSLASFPRYWQIACTPPGCTGIKAVMSTTSPLTISHASSFLLCSATSASVNVGGPVGTAGAGGAALAAGGPASCIFRNMAISSSLSLAMRSASDAFSVTCLEAGAGASASNLNHWRRAVTSFFAGCSPPFKYVAAPKPAAFPEDIQCRSGTPVFAYIF